VDVAAQRKHDTDAYKHTCTHARKPPMPSRPHAIQDGCIAATVVVFYAANSFLACNYHLPCLLSEHALFSPSTRRLLATHILAHAP